MFLTQKIQASGLAEMVIAIAVIALCFGVASLVFVRTSKVISNFQDVKMQTEIQSAMWEAMQNNQELEEWDELEVLIVNDDSMDSLKIVQFVGANERIIWSQQRTNE